MFSKSNHLQKRKFFQYQQKCTKVELKIYQIQNKPSKNGQTCKMFPKWRIFAIFVMKKKIERDRTERKIKVQKGIKDQKIVEQCR